jgi:very-short-patch-repair endonuclease
MHVDRSAQILAERQHGVIERGQALGLGFTRRSIAGRLAANRWESMYPGVYRISGSTRTWAQRIQAACLAAGTGGVASHHSAARLWSLPGFDERLEVTIPHARRVTVSGVIVHRAVRLTKGEIRRVESIPATSLARTLVDLASVATPETLESALDHVLANRRVSLRQISRSLECVGRRGREGAGKLAALLAARPAGVRLIDSEFEARLLRVMRAHRLPEPACQYRVGLRNGKKAYLDFAYPDALLAIEADGYRFHSSLGAWSKDRIRNNELVALGWRVLPVTFRDMTQTPELVVDQITRALTASEKGKVGHEKGARSSRDRPRGRKEGLR